MSPTQWCKTMDLTNYTPIILTNKDIGKRFVLVNGNIKQIGTFNKFSPDKNRAYFTFDGKSSPISVSIDPNGGYKVYSIDNISKMGTYPLTNLPPELQQNIAGFYGGRKSRRIKIKSRKSNKSNKSNKRKSRQSKKRQYK
jgi:hypothetical protein